MSEALALSRASAVLLAALGLSGLLVISHHRAPFRKLPLEAHLTSGVRPVGAITSAPLPPPIVPVTLEALTPDQARAMNAAIPIVKGRLPAARPFTYTGTDQDYANALICLSSAVWYEAGDDKEGEQAVAQVVLNRLRHPAFPKSICGVVFQGSDRETGCQFTFTCDGSINRVPGADGWARARKIAREALSGFVFKPVGTSTHYHTDWVVPYWRSSLDKVAKIHTQIFYRWQGRWGEPVSFSGRPQPGEALDPRLAYLLPETQQPAAVMEGVGEPLLTPVTLTATGSQSPSPPSSARNVGGLSILVQDEARNAFIVALDRSALPGSYALAALELCKDRPNCLVLGWMDPTNAPQSVTDATPTMASLSFMYRRVAGGAALDAAYWNCSEMPRGNSTQCLPHAS
jgi:spore germination cell wall hydrolase CwlJ-like protein